MSARGARGTPFSDMGHYASITEAAEVIAKRRRCRGLYFSAWLPTYGGKSRSPTRRYFPAWNIRAPHTITHSRGKPISSLGHTLVCSMSRRNERAEWRGFQERENGDTLICRAEGLFHQLEFWYRGPGRLRSREGGKAAVYPEYGIEQRAAIGTVIGIDRAREWVISNIEGRALAWIALRPCRRSAAGAVRPACRPLLRKLPVNVLPVKEDVGEAARQMALVLCINRVVADAPEAKILPADFDGEVAETLAGRNECALLTLHLPPSLFLQIMQISYAPGKTNEPGIRRNRAIFGGTEQWHRRQLRSQLPVPVTKLR